MYVSWSVEAVAGILGAIALTVSLFTQNVPETAGALTILNHPLFIVGILAVLLAVTLGGSLMGILGMLLYVPLFAAGYRILREVVQNTSPLVEQNSEKT